MFSVKHRFLRREIIQIYNIFTSLNNSEAKGIEISGRDKKVKKKSCQHMNTHSAIELLIFEMLCHWKFLSAIHLQRLRRDWIGI